MQDLYIPAGLARQPRGRAAGDARPELEVSATKNVIVTEYLDAVRRLAHPPARRASLAELERELRTGPFGMCQAQFRAITLALIHTGHVTPLAGGRPRAAAQVNALTLRQVTELGLGEVVDGELWRRVTGSPLVPARFRGVPPTVPLQAELLAAFGELRREARELAESVRRAVERCRGYRSLAGADLAGALRDADAAGRLARAIESGASDALAVLEAVDAACRAEPELAEALRRTRERAGFFADKLDSCVRLHDYLHHGALVVPAEPPYAELSALLDQARSLLAVEAAATDSRFGSRSAETFEAFRAAWAERYLREHQRLADDPRFAGLEEIRRSEPYRLLSRLGELPGVATEHDKVAIDRLLAAARSRRCLRLRPETLHQRPACDCGFLLGSGLDLPEPAAVQEQVLLGLAEVSSSLLSGTLAERLRASAAGLRAVGRAAEARALTPLLERAPVAPTAAASEILALARELHGAEPVLAQSLAAPIEVAERDGDALLARLAGRTMTVETVRSAVESWLAGTGPAPPAGAYVHIGSALLAPVDGPGRHLQEIVEQRFPELGALARRPDQLLMLAAVVRSARHHGAPPDRWLAWLPRAGLHRALPAPAGDASVQIESHAALAAALFDESAEAAALARRASDLLEAAGLDALSLALVADSGPASSLAALATERTISGLLRIFTRRFLRAAENAPGELPEPPAAVAAGPVAALAEELLQAAAARTRLRAAALAATTLGDDPPGARALTDIYLERLWSLEGDLARLERLATRHDLLDSAGLAAVRNEARTALDRTDRAFSRLCAERYPGWQTDGRGGPTFLPRALQEARARLRADLGAEPAAIVLVDALRLDVWRSLRTRLESSPSPGAPGRTFRVLFEAAAWAHRPDHHRREPGHLARRRPHPFAGAGGVRPPGRPRRDAGPAARPSGALAEPGPARPPRPRSPRSARRGGRRRVASRDCRRRRRPTAAERISAAGRPRLRPDPRLQSGRSPRPAPLPPRGRLPVRAHRPGRLHFAPLIAAARSGLERRYLASQALGFPTGGVEATPAGMWLAAAGHMRLVFDRGTIVLAEAPQGLNLEHIPGDLVGPPGLGLPGSGPPLLCSGSGATPSGGAASGPAPAETRAADRIPRSPATALPGGGAPCVAPCRSARNRGAPHRQLQDAGGARRHRRHPDSRALPGAHPRAARPVDLGARGSLGWPDRLSRRRRAHPGPRHRGDLCQRLPAHGQPGGPLWIPSGRSSTRSITSASACTTRRWRWSSPPCAWA